jgi:hypothetical protein
MTHREACTPLTCEGVCSTNIGYTERQGEMKAAKHSDRRDVPFR